MAAHAYPIHSIRLRAELAPEQLAAALSVSDEKATLRGVTACFLYIMTATPHQTCLKELGARSCGQCRQRRKHLHPKTVCIITIQKHVLAETRTWRLVTGINFMSIYDLGVLSVKLSVPLLDRRSGDSAAIRPRAERALRARGGAGPRPQTPRGAAG